MSGNDRPPDRGEELAKAIAWITSGGDWGGLLEILQPWLEKACTSEFYRKQGGVWGVTIEDVFDGAQEWLMDKLRENGSANWNSEDDIEVQLRRLILRSAHNAIDAIRRKKKRDKQFANGAGNVEAVGNSLLEEMVLDEEQVLMRHQLEFCIRELTDKQKRVFALLRRGKTGLEVAMELKTSPQSVSNIKVRALQLLSGCVNRIREGA